MTGDHRDPGLKNPAKIRGLLVFVGLVVLIGSCTRPPWAPVGPGPTRGAAPPPVEGPTLQGRPVSIDDQLVRIARQVPGFGGMFISADTLYVYLVDTSQLKAAEAAIVSVFGRERIPSRGVKALQAKYDFVELKGWHDQQRFATLALPGVISTGVSKSENRLKINVDDENRIARVEQELSRLGVPREMVNIVVSEPIEPHSTHTVQDRQRPLLGGIEILGGLGCTLGFLAVRNGVAGFVTVSHCTSKEGGVENTVFFQPNSDDAADRIGVEIADPVYVGSSGLVAGSKCPSGRTCRYSDSAFIKRDSGTNQSMPAIAADFGAIALPYPSGLGFNGSKALINKKAWLPIEGEFVAKVGRTTGYTEGKVIDACEDVNKKGQNVTLLCQYRVKGIAAPGDSGAPVFEWTSPLCCIKDAPNSATLYGILWGGPASGGKYAFSPMLNIQLDLGLLKAWWYEEGPGIKNGQPEVKIVAPKTGSGASPGALNIVTFKASVEDYEDGTNCCQVKWSSDLEGPMGGGKALEYGFTKPGTHTITATAKDSDGAISTFSIKIVVSDYGLPTVKILKPTKWQTLYEGKLYTFDSESSEPGTLNVPLACDHLTWTSDPLAAPFPVTGCQPQITFASPGWYTIRLIGKDKQGKTAEDKVGVYIAKPYDTAKPVVGILNPKDNNGVPAKTVVTLTGQATDSGGQSLSYQWIVMPKSPAGHLKGGATEIVLATGTMQSGQNVTFQWKPSDQVPPYFCGESNPVELLLNVTNADGRLGWDLVNITVDYPPC